MRKITLFISSTCDLPEERFVCHDVIDMINLEHSKEYRVELIKWETHANPVVKTTFQEEINNELIKADIVCFVIYNRLGTHTHEEFDFAIKNRIGKFVLEKEFSPKLSSIPISDIENYLELRRFLDPMANMLGKYTYDSIEGFKLHLRECLGKYIANLKIVDANASLDVKTKESVQSKDSEILIQMIRLNRNNPEFLNGLQSLMTSYVEM